MIKLKIHYIFVIVAIATLLTVDVGVDAVRKTGSSGGASSSSGSSAWGRSGSSRGSSSYGYTTRSYRSSHGSNDYDDYNDNNHGRNSDDGMNHDDNNNSNDSTYHYSSAPPHVTLPSGAHYVAKGSPLPPNVIYVPQRPSREILNSGDGYTIGNVLYYSYSRKNQYRNRHTSTTTQAPGVESTTPATEITAPNGIICLSVKVPQPNPQNAAMTIEGEKTICYPAPEPEPQQNPLNGENVPLAQWICSQCNKQKYNRICTLCNGRFKNGP